MFAAAAVHRSVRPAWQDGFLIAAEAERLWTYGYDAKEAELPYEQTFTPAELVATSPDLAVNCIVWFFERFGWLKPNTDAMRADQQKLLTRNILKWPTRANVDPGEAGGEPARTVRAETPHSVDTFPPLALLFRVRWNRAESRAQHQREGSRVG